MTEAQEELYSILREYASMVDDVYTPEDLIGFLDNLASDASVQVGLLLKEEA